MSETISVRSHFEALRAADEKLDGVREAHRLEVKTMLEKFSQLEASWIKEKFDLHNNILRAWQLASAEDRGNFVKTATFEALKEAFGVNTVTTAKALTLAEGKTRGFESVRIAVAFACGILVSIAATYGMLKGLR